MVTRAPFLKTRYSGYHHRQVPPEDPELTHVGPETPCGEYMRRFFGSRSAIPTSSRTCL